MSSHYGTFFIVVVFLFVCCFLFVCLFVVVFFCVCFLCVFFFCFFVLFFLGGVPFFPLYFLIFAVSFTASNHVIRNIYNTTKMSTK